MRLENGTYTGNGTSQTINLTDGSFGTPDVVWVVADPSGSSNAMWRAKDGIYPGNNTHGFTNGYNDSNGITAIGNAQFSVGSNSRVNTDQTTYHYLAFRDDSNNDFEVGHYVGDGTGSRTISLSGLTGTPVLLFVMSSAFNQASWKSDQFAALASARFNDSRDNSGHLETLGAGQFDVNGDVNVDQTDYLYMAFTSVAEYVESQTYVGDGNDDRDVPIGTTSPLPLFATIRHNLNGGNQCLFRMNSYTADECSIWNGAGLGNHIQDLKAGAVEIGNAGFAINVSGQNYSLSWFRDNPAGAPPTGVADVFGKVHRSPLYGTTVVKG